jgi:hypothetical protein
MTVTNNIYQKQIKYHVFNAVTNSELTELILQPKKSQYIHENYDFETVCILIHEKMQKYR